MTQYCTDSIKLDAERVTEYQHDVYGAVTVFHDVVIASEIVQPYLDGMAFKSRDELQSYAWTVDGRWVMTGKHPDDGIISERDQVHGRTVNPRYVKDLIDPNTKRPNRAGVRANVEIFNDKISKKTLEDMKNGVKKDVSIGFFFTKDATPGVVADGAFKGSEYDYVQRNMFHDHLAAGIDQGRCPSPYCGLGADEVKQRLTGDPFAGFSNFAECEATIADENPELTEEQVAAICGKLKSENEDSISEETVLESLKNKIHDLLNEEYEALRGEKLARKEGDEGDWWRRIDWTSDTHREIFDALGDETRVLIMEAGLCPDCQNSDEEEECPEGQHKDDEGKCVPDEEEESMEDIEEDPEEEQEEDSVKPPVIKKLDPREVIARFDSLKKQ